MRAVSNEKFRGLSAVELAEIIDLASRMAPVVIMKSANKIENTGKSPELVLAEHMIVACNAQEVVTP